MTNRRAEEPLPTIHESLAEMSVQQLTRTMGAIHRQMVCAEPGDRRDQLKRILWTAGDELQARQIQKGIGRKRTSR